MDEIGPARCRSSAAEHRLCQ